MERAEDRAETYGEPRPVENRDSGSMADGIVDDLLSDDFDWRRTVWRHPLPALLVAGLGGFLLGQRHGSDILSAVRSFIDREVSKNIQGFLGEDR